MPRRGLTLVELLVSIGVIAVLLGLLAPTLAGARVAAREVNALAQLRNLGVTMELYLQEFRSVYPWHKPGTPYEYAPPGIPSGTLLTSDSPWDMRYFWPTAMHRVAPWAEHYPSWLGGRRADGLAPWMTPDGSQVYPVYAYSNSFIGDPACWLATGSPRAAPVRATAVRFPASKALMFDAVRPYLPIAHRDRPTRGVLSADGSAAMRDDRQAARPVENRMRPGMGAHIYHDTPGGVLGRDF